MSTLVFLACFLTLYICNQSLLNSFLNFKFIVLACLLFSYINIEGGPNSLQVLNYNLVCKNLLTNHYILGICCVYAWKYIDSSIYCKGNGVNMHGLGLAISVAIALHVCCYNLGF